MGTELMNLVAFHDKELITTSSIVARVFGKRHADVLRSIEDIISQLETLRLVDHQRTSALMVGQETRNSEELVDGEDEGETEPARVREHGRRAGKLVTDPLYPPTEEELALEERKKWVAARQAEIAKNTIDSSKWQYFRRVEVPVKIGSGATRMSYEYEMNRTGFFHLVRRFTGTEALRFWQMFFDEFDRLEHIAYDQLRKHSEELLAIHDGDVFLQLSNEREQHREQISALKGENRDLLEELQEANRKIAVMTEKGNGYMPAYRAIRKELIKDMAGTHFYVPIKAAEKIIKRARTYKTEDRLRSTIEHLGVLIDQSLDLGVDTLISNGTDPEAMFDEDTVLKYEKKLFGVTD